MTVYFVFLLVLLSLTIVSLIDRRNGNIYFIFFSLVCIFFSSIRYNTGADYGSYTEIFNEIKHGINTLYLERIEIGYKFLNYFCIFLGLGVNSVFLICNIIIFINLNFVWDMLKVNKCLSGFSFVCFLYLTNTFNLVRHGVATSFLFVAIILLMKKKLFLSYLCVVIGSLFHYIVLCFFLLQFFVEKKYKKNFILICIIIGYFLSSNKIIGTIVNNLPDGLSLFSTLKYYANKENTSVYGLGTLLKLLIFFYYTYLQKSTVYNYSIKNMTINLSFFYFLTIFIFNSIPTLSERLSNIFTIGFILIMYDLLLINLRDKKYIHGFVFFLCILIFFVHILITPATPGSFGYIPYQNIFFK